jgi:para-nitrobenzyl esterase
VKKTAQTAEDGLQSTARLLRALNLNDVERLAAIPIDAIMKAQLAEMGPAQPGMRPFSPVIDGANLPEQPFGDHAPACSKTIPLIIGSNTEELRAFNTQRPELFKLDEAGLKKELLGELGARTDSVIVTYRAARPKDSPTDIYFAITAGNFYWAGSIAMAEKKAAMAAEGGAPVYMYRYGYDPQRATRGDKPTIGAGHGQELAYVFRRVKADREPAALKLQDQMSVAWANFARSGKPSAPNLPVWPVYTLAKRQTMIFDPPSRVISDPDSPERQWWGKNW